MVELSSKTFRVAIAAMAITLSVDAAMAENANAPRTLKEGHGLSLDIGSKKLAGYYLAKSGVCEVTVMVADRLDADGHGRADCQA